MRDSRKVGFTTVTVGGLVSGNGSLPVSLRLYYDQHMPKIVWYKISYSPVARDNHGRNNPKKNQSIELLDLPYHSDYNLGHSHCFP